MICILLSPHVVVVFKDWFSACGSVCNITPFRKNHLVLRVEGWKMSVDVIIVFPSGLGNGQPLPLC